MSNSETAAFDSDAAAKSGAARRRPGALARLARLTRLALPQRCALCVAPAADALVCADCAAALPRLTRPCAVCALPSGGSSVCGACVARPPPFAATIAALVYAFPVDRLLHDFKYGSRLALADWAAATLAAAVAPLRDRRDPESHLDLIVPLPLAASRQRERGFNQAREIAARLAPLLALPIATPLVRIGGGPPQAALSWSERARNVRGAFAVAGDVANARVALVDDVMTTGATLTEAARVLRHAGAARVECWVVARTLRPHGG